MTRIIAELGSYIFLRTPQGLASLGQGEEDIKKKKSMVLKEGIDMIYRHCIDIVSMKYICTGQIEVSGGFKEECDLTDKKTGPHFHHTLLVLRN